MSDFEGVDFITDMPEGSGSSDPAPEGTHDAKIIDVEKYQSPNSGNWTCKVVFQIDGGTYRDHTEWYNLWHPTKEIKNLSNSLFNKNILKPVDSNSFFLSLILNLVSHSVAVIKNLLSQ